MCAAHVECEKNTILQNNILGVLVVVGGGVCVCLRVCGHFLLKVFYLLWLTKLCIEDNAVGWFLIYGSGSFVLRSTPLWTSLGLTIH